MRFVILYVCVSALSAIVFSTNGTAEEPTPQQPTSPKTRDGKGPKHVETTLDVDEDEVFAANWKLLVFNKARKGYRILKIRLILRNYNAQLPKFDPTPTVDVASEDPLVLARAMRGMNEASRGIYAAGDSLANGGYPFGELRVTTTEGEFVVMLDHEFGLSRDFVDSRNCFCSWTLAKVVDDLLKKAGRRLWKEQFESLSGEGGLNAAKRAYAKEEAELSQPSKN